VKLKYSSSSEIAILEALRIGVPTEKDYKGKSSKSVKKPIEEFSKNTSRLSISQLMLLKEKSPLARAEEP
jgi:hypothetical protein